MRKSAQRESEGEIMERYARLISRDGAKRDLHVLTEEQAEQLNDLIRCDGLVR